MWKCKCIQNDFMGLFLQPIWQFNTILMLLYCRLLILWITSLQWNHICILPIQVCYRLKPYYINYNLCTCIFSVAYKSFVQTELLYLISIIGTIINYHLFISCNTFGIVMKYKTVSHSVNNIIIAVGKGRPMHRIGSIAFSYYSPQIQDISAHIILKESLVHASGMSQWQASCSFLPWCTVIAGYWVNSDNRNM